MVELLLTQGFNGSMCQGASPFIAKVIIALLIVYCQLLHESHHHLELLVYKKAVVIGKLCTHLGCGTHLAVHEA